MYQIGDKIVSDAWSGVIIDIEEKRLFRRGTRIPDPKDSDRTSSNRDSEK